LEDPYELFSIILRDERGSHAQRVHILAVARSRRLFILLQTKQLRKLPPLLVISVLRSRRKSTENASESSRMTRSSSGKLSVGMMRSREARRLREENEKEKEEKVGRESSCKKSHESVPNGVRKAASEAMKSSRQFYEL
jgi:hypothetical protein